MNPQPTSTKGMAITTKNAQKGNNCKSQHPSSDGRCSYIKNEQQQSAMPWYNPIS